MGSNIDELIENINNTKLSGEEDKLVDSIINDLNNVNQPQPQPTMNNQPTNIPPQLTPEERQLMLKQQQHQQQMIYEQKMQQQKMQQMQQMQQQQMQQQQMQQQMQQQQMQQQQEENKGQEKKEEIIRKNPTIYQKILELKDPIIVFLLIFFFNLSTIDECIRFKQFSFFYNIENESSTILFSFTKGLFIALLYYLLSQFI
tara:strand:+ start:657 stop:1259 length:603 start_codon:yes stop_codon:yes gene_type:complete